MLLTKVTHGVCDTKELRATTSCGYILCISVWLSNTRLFVGRPRRQSGTQKLASLRSGLPIQPTPGKIRVWISMKSQRRIHEVLLVFLNLTTSCAPSVSVRSTWVYRWVRNNPQALKNSTIALHLKSILMCIESKEWCVLPSTLGERSRTQLCRVEIEMERIPLIVGRVKNNLAVRDSHFGHRTLLDITVSSQQMVSYTCICTWGIP
jgi:hypothetical protein